MSDFTSSASDPMQMDQSRLFIDVLRKNLIDRRRQANMTQSELASRMHYSTSTVSNFERGESEMTLVWLWCVCHILNINIIFVVEQAAKLTQEAFSHNVHQ